MGKCAQGKDNIRPDVPLMLSFRPEHYEQETACSSAVEALCDTLSDLERDAITAINYAIRFCGYAKEDIEVRSERNRNDVQEILRKEYWSKSEKRLLAAYWQSAAVNDARVILTRDLSPLKERYQAALLVRVR